MTILPAHRVRRHGKVLEMLAFVTATVRRPLTRCADLCGCVRGNRGESQGRAMHGELSVESTESVALQVREELARRRLSRQWLADEAKVSLSTLEKALAGRRPFTCGLPLTTISPRKARSLVARSRRYLNSKRPGLWSMKPVAGAN